MATALTVTAAHTAVIGVIADKCTFSRQNSKWLPVVMLAAPVPPPAADVPQRGRGAERALSVVAVVGLLVYLLLQSEK